MQGLMYFPFLVSVIGPDPKVKGEIFEKHLAFLFSRKLKLLLAVSKNRPSARKRRRAWKARSKEVKETDPQTSELEISSEKESLEGPHPPEPELDQTSESSNSTDFAQPKRRRRRRRRASNRNAEPPCEASRNTCSHRMLSREALFLVLSLAVCGAALLVVLVSNFQPLTNE